MYYIGMINGDELIKEYCEEEKYEEAQEAHDRKMEISTKVANSRN